MYNLHKHKYIGILAASVLCLMAAPKDDRAYFVFEGPSAELLAKVTAEQYPGRYPTSLTHKEALDILAHFQPQNLTLFNEWKESYPEGKLNQDFFNSVLEYFHLDPINHGLSRYRVSSCDARKGLTSGNRQVQHSIHKWNVEINNKVRILTKTYERTSNPGLPPEEQQINNSGSASGSGIQLQPDSILQVKQGQNKIPPQQHEANLIADLQEGVADKQAKPKTTAKGKSRKSKFVPFGIS